MAPVCSVLALAVCAATVVVILASQSQDPLRQALSGAGAWRFGFRGSLIVFGATFALAGVLIAFRRPANRIGLIFSAGGLVMAVDAFALEYPSVVGGLHSLALPDRAVVAWLANWLWVPGLALTMFLLFVLFPDGRLPSSRWRPVLAGAVIACAAVTGARALRPGALGMYPSIPNPLSAGFRWLDTLLRLESAAGRLMLSLLVLAAAAMMLRFRRAGPTRRQQLKWFAAAAVFFAMSLVAEQFAAWTYTQIVVLVAAASVPAAVTIAVLRYRLYDIDRIISRTLGYALVTGILLGAYVGLVVLFQRVLSPLTGSSDIAVAASTLIVAAASVPVRRRVQRAVDRRFNRARYDAARTIEAFSSRLREQVDIDALGTELEALVRRTMQPTHVSLWTLRPP